MFFKKTYLFLCLLGLISSCIKANKPQKVIRPKSKLVVLKQDTLYRKYSLRKYAHVKAFYSRLTVPVTELCIKENVPPAAVLAMAGLESGWNRGYVGRITGNILSLGARKGDKELPALNLPIPRRSGEVIFDSLEISKYNNSGLIWKKRPKSLKKDYRPNAIAGTKYQLGYFKRHPKAEAEAQLHNISDFLNVFISHKSKIKAYRKARFTLDSLVSLHGKAILLEEKTALLFINAISGRPNTFNYRKTWPKKVTYILKNAGLVSLTKKVFNDKLTFNQAWK